MLIYGADAFDAGLRPLDHHPTASLTPLGLALHFKKYEITAGAMGAPIAEIPWCAAAPLLASGTVPVAAP